MAEVEQSLTVPSNLKSEYVDMFAKHMEMLKTTRAAVEDACTNKATDKKVLCDAKGTLEAFRKDKKGWGSLKLAYPSLDAKPKAKAKRKGRS